MFIWVTAVSLILLLSFFLLISYSKVRIIFHRRTRLEITIAFLKLELYNFEKKNSKRPNIRFYKCLHARLARLFRVSHVVVERLDVPIASSRDKPVYILPYGYHTAISAAIAYIGSYSRRLDVEDGAVNLFFPNDDGRSLQLRLTARTRLFYILKTVFFIVSDRKKIEEKEDKEYVGRGNE